MTSSPDGPDLTALVVRALTLYSLAEAQAGHASAIHVAAAGRSFSVRDDGRGHAIQRTVAGTPYLAFVYTHLDYPFAATEGGPVQLHGIGMSLINALCSELSVDVRKPDGVARLTYRAGHLSDEARVDLAGAPTENTGPTGNTVAGVVSHDLQRIDTDVEAIERWLLGVIAANPAVRLTFNGKDVGAPPREPTAERATA